YQLRCKKALRLVCDGISGIILRSFRQKRKDLRQDFPHSIAFQGGNGNYGFEIEPLPITLHQRQQLAFISERIDLVDHEYCRRMNPAKVAQNVFIYRSVSELRLYHEDNHVAFAQGGKRCCYESSVELVLCLVYSRRIH